MRSILSIWKKMGAAALCMALLLGGACSASAQTWGQGVSPCYEESNYATVQLNYSNNVACCSARIYGKSGTSKISARMVLRDAETNATVTSWTASSTSKQCSSDKSVTVKSGKSYTLECVATVYDADGNWEQVSKSTTKAN